MASDIELPVSVGEFARGEVRVFVKHERRADCHRSSHQSMHETGIVEREWNGLRYIAFTIPSTIFFASENSIMVLSRKKSSFSIPA